MSARVSQNLARGVDSIVGVSPWVQQIRADILRVAAYDSSVLITGPSGTGKELVARALCAHGRRANAPMVPVDCAALTGELFASQVFGHVKGAFTGAHYDALGAFRAAEGGTVLLDEIGELEPHVQAKLLRVIQEKTVVPLGSHRGEPIDVRIIAATNRELQGEIQAGRFREDLYYRLNVISLRTTALKDRPEDIEVLANRFLCKLAVEAGLPLKHLTPGALHLMRSYPWPGNVRQLHNQLERAAVRTEGDWIGLESISELLEGGPATADSESRCSRDMIVNQHGSSEATPGDHLPQGRFPTLAEVERQHVVHALEKSRYNQCAAARLLGIDRHALRRKMRKYGLSLPGRASRSNNATDARCRD